MAMPEKVMNAHNNVVSMNKWEVYKEIECFLNDLGNKSKNTRSSYKKGLERFFEIVKNKPLEFLTRDDVQLTFKDFQGFVSEMKKVVDENGLELNNKTINGNITAVVELIKYLNQVGIVEDIKCVSNLKRVRLPTNDNEYGILTIDEVWDFANWVKDNEINFADTKYYFILFSLDTCLRKNAVLNLTWDNFIVGEENVAVKAIDKGNKDFRSTISLEFYNQLLELKECDTDNVFKIASTTIQATLDRWKNARGVPTNRRIVVHSIRKAGASFQYKLTSDILQVKKALGHSNVNTTQKYLGTENYGAVGAVSRGIKIDPNLYKSENVTKEDLIKAIEGLTGYSTMINIKLHEELNNK